jgi:hypothetical protein
METAVNSAEAEKPVRLPGIKAASPVHPAGAPAAASSISSTLVRYYSSLAPSAYVNQPATNVINMDRAHTLATGAGVVATIDTGVDFMIRVEGRPHVGLGFCEQLSGGSEQADESGDHSDSGSGDDSDIGPGDDADPGWRNGRHRAGNHADSGSGDARPYWTAPSTRHMVTGRWWPD